MTRSSENGFRSGSLAKAAGLSPDTIRHYENMGVLPKAVRTAAGYRIYPTSALERVRIVQSALSVGFTLAELADVFKTRDAGGAPCRRVYEIAQEKLARIAADIEALKRTERYLKEVLSNWEEKLRTSPGQKSYLLHSLPTAINRTVSTTQNLRSKRKP